MADNVAITAGSGTTIATDDIGGIHYQRVKLHDSTADSANGLVINSAGQASVNVGSNSLVSTANSSTANLAGAAVFTGTSEDISEYSEARVTVFSSHASATDGLSMQQSADGTNWDITDTYTVSAGVAKIVGVGTAAKYFRLVYTNGATLTTSLRIQTVYHKSRTRPSSVRPQDARTNETDLEEVSSFLFGYNGTTWDRLRSTTANGLAVDVTRLPSIPTGANVIGAVTQSGTWNVGSITTLPALVAGTALIGKVGIDQTTVGTTNAVYLTGVGSTGIVTGGTAGLLGVGGPTAIGVAKSGNPVRAGFVGKTAANTAVTDGQVVDGISDKVGRQVVTLAQVRDLAAAQATTITSSTSATTVVTAAGASTFADITHIDVSNGSATATAVTLSDGTNSFLFNVPAGGGFVCDYTVPLKGTTANTAWTLTCGTSVASIYCNVVYVKNT